MAEKIFEKFTQGGGQLPAHKRSSHKLKYISYLRYQTYKTPQYHIHTRCTQGAPENLAQFVDRVAKKFGEFLGGGIHK